MPRTTDPDGALGGIRSVVLSPSYVGMQVAQFMADNGSEVVIVEPTGGSPLRRAPAWPAWSRGSKSIEVDLDEQIAAAHVAAIASGADVVFEAFRPNVVERWGLGYEQLAGTNPALVYASVTAFGRDGPLARLKGYEGAVMAKIGAYDQFTALVDRSGPAFASVPYCSFSAAQLAIQGILTALFERTRSGLGQRVDTTLVQGVAAHDVFGWMIRHAAQQYPGAFREVPPVDPRTQVPNTWMAYALMIGLSADGRWLQFSQATPKLFRAFLRSIALDGPEWDRAWEDDDLARRSEFRDRALTAIRGRTLEEWQEVFDNDPDIFAEVFRRGHELFSHPQLVHDRRFVEVEDRELGRVLQTAPLVQMSGTPGRGDRGWPSLDEHGEDLRRRRRPTPTPQGPSRSATPRSRPLDGVTILELGTFFAGPFGATLLTDLGARVIKIEQLDGDPIRWQVPMPEVGAIKVLLGKESVAIDFNRPEGQALVHEIAGHCDVALVTFRAGVAERVHMDEETLRAIRPDLVYHTASGFGVEGPYAHRPAYAPTIGAGSGMARRNIGDAVAENRELSLDQIKAGATRLFAAGATVGHPDGFSGICVATGLLLGVVARALGHGGQTVRTTMLSTMSHVLSDDLIDYEGRPGIAGPDAGLHGLDTLYRLYETADGWVFLAVRRGEEWVSLIEALGAPLGSDARFAGPADRQAHDEELAQMIGDALSTRSAREWEAVMAAVDVACVEVAAGPSHAVLMDPDGLGRSLGMVTDVDHPILGRHPRLAPVLRFSRSATRAEGAPAIGQHTDSVLAEFGVEPERIAELRADGVIV